MQHHMQSPAGLPHLKQIGPTLSKRGTWKEVLAADCQVITPIRRSMLTHFSLTKWSAQIKDTQKHQNMKLTWLSGQCQLIFCMTKINSRYLWCQLISPTNTDQKKIKSESWISYIQNKIIGSVLALFVRVYMVERITNFKILPSGVVDSYFFNARREDWNSKAR